MVFSEEFHIAFINKELLMGYSNLKWGVILALSLSINVTNLSSALGSEEPPISPDAKPAITGKEIVTKSENINPGSDQRSKLTFHFKEKDGSERKMVMQRFWKNYRGENGVDSKVMIFQEYPPESKGSGFMGWFYRSGPKKSESWLYIPVLRKVIQLPESNNDEAFQGSDLRPGDMAVRNVEEDSHTYLGEETIDGKGYYVVESVPKAKDPFYKYGKVVKWISKDLFLKDRVDYYDESGKLFKKQTIAWSKIKDAWIWSKVDTQNVQTGVETHLDVSEIRIDTGLQDSHYSERSLKGGPASITP
jgi:hypothetical protein